MNPLVTTPVVNPTRTFATDVYSVSDTPTASAAASSGTPVGTLVGIIGGSLVGLVVLATVAGCTSPPHSPSTLTDDANFSDFFRRAFRKKDDDFDRDAFVRNSIALHDEK